MFLNCVSSHTALIRAKYGHKQHREMTYLDRVKKDANDVSREDSLAVLDAVIIAAVAKFTVVEGPSIFGVAECLNNKFLFVMSSLIMIRSLTFSVSIYLRHTPILIRKPELILTS